MEKNISKKLAASVALGAAAVSQATLYTEADAVEMPNGNPAEGATDANGNLLGYYDENGTWVPNKIYLKIRHTEPITMQIYKVSDEVDLSTREIYMLDKNSAESKLCVRDSFNKRPIAGATINVKDKNGNVVGTYTTDADGYIYYENLSLGNYTTEAVSLPQGSTYDGEKITRSEYVEDIVLTEQHRTEDFLNYDLSLPVGTYLIWWQPPAGVYKGLSFGGRDDLYLSGVNKLCLKMKGIIPLQWIPVLNINPNVEMGYMVYEVDKNGTDLGPVEGAGANVRCSNIDGSYFDEYLSSDENGTATVIYNKTAPDSVEYAFNVNSLPDNLTFVNPEDQYFSFIPADGLETGFLMKYIPVAATSSVKVKIYDEKTGECINGATFQLLDENGTVVQNADGVSEFTTGTPDADGFNGVIESLLIGKYQVKVTALPDDGTEEGYIVPDSAISIESTKGVVNTYDIPVSHYGHVKVNVVNADTGETISDTNISVNLYENASSTPFANLTIDEFLTYYRKGKIEEDTTVRVELCFPVGTYALTSLTQNNADNTTTDLEWNKTGTYQNQVSTVLSRDGFDLTYALTVRTGDLSVKVQDKNTKEPIPDAKVEIYDKAGNKVGSGTTDENGKVTAQDLLPGDYVAKVVDPTIKYLPSDEELPLTVVVDTETSGILELERDQGYVQVIVKEKLQSGDLATFYQAVNLVINDADGNPVHNYATNNSGVADPVLLDSDKYTVLIKDAITGYTILELNGKEFTVSKSNTTEVVLTVERDRNDLSVLVVDDETDLPLAESEVTIYDSDNVVVETLTTDATGVVALEKVPTGTYYALVTKPTTGYNAPSDKQKIVVTKEDDGTTTIRLVRQKADVTIRVEDLDGNLVKNATVEYGQEQSTYMTVLGQLASGTVTVQNIPTDAYLARVVSPYPQHYLGTPESEKTFVVTENGENLVILKLQLKKLELSFEVEDAETGEKLSGTEISLEGSDALGISGTGTTDDKGYYSFGTIPANLYNYWVSKAPEGYSVPAKATVDLDAATENVHVVIQLTRDKQSLTVTVRDRKTNDIIPGATVQVTDSEGDVHTAVSDEKGQVYFDKIPTGTVTIETTAVPEGYTPEEKITTTVTKETPAEATVYVNRDMGDLTVTSYIEGADTVLPDCSVDIIDTATNVVYKTVVTDQNGQAKLTDVPTGNYRVVITKAPDGYDPTVEDVVDIVKDGEHTARVEAKREIGKLQVIVKDGKGTDDVTDDVYLSNVEVTITELATNKTYEVKTDENGQFTTDFIPTGDYKVEVTGGLAYIYTIPAAKDAEVFYKDEPTVVIFNLTEDKNALHVQVVEEGTNTPLKNIAITLSNGSKYTTDDFGYVHIPEILVGEYVASVDGNLVPDTHKLTNNSSKTVEVTKNAEGRVVLELARKKGDLEVTVVDKDTKDPVPSAKVEVYDNSGNKVGEGTTDEDGNLFVEGLPTGDYVVKVTDVPDGYRKPDDTTVTVEDEKLAEKVIELEKQKGDLDITIVDKDTKDPIPSAKVEVYDKDGNKVGEGMTDESGKLLVENLPAGDYVIKVVEVPDGYNKPDDVTVAVEDEKITETVVEIEKQKGDLNITVVDKDTKEPVANTKVVVKDKDGNKVGDGVTSEKGNLIVEDLPIGKYTVEVTETPEHYNLPDSVSAVVEDERVTNVVIEVEKKKGDLDVTVVDKDTKEPVPDAKVEIYDKDGNKVGEGETDKDGNLIIEDLPIGDYVVKVVEVPDGYNKPDDVKVTVEDEKVTETTIEIEKKKGDLDVTVIDKDTKEPIPEAKVEVYDKDGNKIGEGKTDKDGKLPVENLVIGDYVIKVVEVPDGYNKPDDTTVTVEDEKVTKTIVEIEKKKGDLNITVVDKETKEPVADTKVAVKDKDGKQVADGETDKHGNLIVENLPIGKYTVEVTETPEHYNVPDSVSAVVEDEKVTNVVIEIEKKKGDLDITVVDKDTKEPIPSAKVEIYDKDGNKVGEGETDKDGNLIVENLVIGDYVIKVVEVPDGYNKPDDVTVAVEGEKVTETVIEIEKQKGHLEITVVDKDTKEPVPEAKVEVYDKDGNKVGTGITNKDGHILIKNLVIGDYVVKVVEVPDGYNMPDDVTVTVEDEKIAKTVIEVEKKKGDLDITVVDKDTKEPVPEAKVEIYDKDGNKVGEGKTDKDGNLLVENLPIGDYVIKVVEVPDGYNKPEDVTVTVEDEKVTETVIEIEKQKGNLKVIVVDKETQKPLSKALVAITDTDGNILHTLKTDGNGEVYVEQMLAGEYIVEVIEAPDDYTAPEAEKVVVENKKTAEKVIELTRDKGNLSIVVEDKETKELLPNIKVVVKDNDGAVVGEYETNENGQVVIKDLPTGSYSVETKDLPAVYKTPAIEVATVEKGETADVLISLEKATGSVTLIAKEKDTSKYLEGVTFEVYDANGKLVGTVDSEKDGLALIDQLVVGEYTAKVVKVPEGFKQVSDEKSFEVGEDQNVIVIFELERKSENIQTGDNSHIGTFGLLAGLSGIGILATRRKKDKKEKE